MAERTPPVAPDAPATTVRASTHADLAAIQSIYAHHVLHGTASFELVPPDLEEIDRRRADVLRNGFPFLVAESGGRVLGYAYANFFRMRPAYRFMVENSIYVAHDAAGRGIGRALLSELIAGCEAAGCRQMLAVIGDSGNVASIALHAACGFRFSGVVRASGWKFDRWLDTVLMQRDLGEGFASAAPAGR
jgi:L-amino acid N-acyltransferase YncA